MQSIKKEDKLYIQAFREIRKYIVENKLKNGDFLPTELSLCETLGISRNVLREAIKSMELMGMVKACPGRGTAVQDFNLDFIFQNVLFFSIGEKEEKTIREMLVLRKTLEISFMNQAFYVLSDEDIRHLRECVEQIRNRWDETKLFSDIDREFHMTLFRPLNNGALNSLLEAIWAVDDGFELEKKVPHLESTISKHEAIVTALENHNFDDFCTAMQAHFSSGKYNAGGTYEEY
ncbi:MAG: hypothetical protein CW338_03375 [Clostridiales bacterium]|nr:hypothetical protein [Clostridiales bacterium]